MSQITTARCAPGQARALLKKTVLKAKFWMNAKSQVLEYSDATWQQRLRLFMRMSTLRAYLYMTPMYHKYHKYA